MRRNANLLSKWPSLTAVLAVCLANGCATPHPVFSVDLPRELQKAQQPPYVIEPPDLLQIDLLAAVPNPPYRVRPLDVLGLTVPEAPPAAPISGPFAVDPNGTISLGFEYGSVSVAGKTIEEAREAVRKHLDNVVVKPTVNLSLFQTRGLQQIRGQHLVKGDGTVGLGVYGSVLVAGLTLPEAKAAIQQHLQKYFQDPEIAVEVAGYNSKVFYVVFDYGGAGQQIMRLPLTGGETILDGVGQTQGLPTVADAREIWLARPQSDGCPHQVLPIDWKAITECGDTRTNYQLLPGDRVVVKAYALTHVDNTLARIISPIERILGVVLLGSTTQNNIRTDPNLVTGVVR
jgi:polysaccharide biosynthesis/export protein